MAGIKPSTIRRMLEQLRHERIDNGAPGVHPQSFLISYATYSPWLTDPDFLADDAELKKLTLVDIYRRYELAQMVRQTAKVPGDILEVGTYKGGTGCLMALTAKRIGSEAKVFLCDTYAGVVKAGPVDRHWKGGEFADTSVEMVEKLLERTGASNAKVLQGIFPDDTGHEIANRRFCLCHIDVDVYLSAKDIFKWVWPRLSIGGVVVVDDYGFPSTPGIRKFMDECSKMKGLVTLYNMNGHGVIVKTR